MTSVPRVRFWHHGPIVGQPRARHSAWIDPASGKARSRTYPDSRQTTANAAIVSSWFLAGAPSLEPGLPFALTLSIIVPRPAGHYLAGGALSAAGRRAGSIPTRKKPDVDNVAKLVLDALARRKDRHTGTDIAGAWDDDARLAQLVVLRRWQTSRAERGGILVDAWTITPGREASVIVDGAATPWPVST